jgi:hypothetical protein
MPSRARAVPARPDPASSSASAPSQLIAVSVRRSARVDPKDYKTMIKLIACFIGAAVLGCASGHTVEAPGQTPASATAVAATAPVASGAKRKACPDAWFENRMPTTDPPSVREYLIYGAERIEPAKVDVDWVRAHCPVKGPSVVE